MDVKALNIHRQMDVTSKLNELPELATQILMLLPLLLHCLYFLILGGPPGAPEPRPPENEKIKPMKQQRQQHQNLFCQFIQLNIHLEVDVKGLNIHLTP